MSYVLSTGALIGDSGRGGSPWQRFQQKVDSGGDCWVWQADLNHKGYGKFQLGNEQLAHRASWIFHFGSIPDGLHVLHRCDNPPCVNPEHLFVGTNQDNMDDKVAKGRQAGIEKTHCVNGHAYDLVNTGRDKKGHRWCRECRRASCRSYYWKRKATYIRPEC